DTTGKGYAAYYAGCNGVCFPALSICCRTRTYHTDTFQPGAESVKNTCQNECAYSYCKYRNTGNRSCFWISAYCIQVFTESSFIPDKPYNSDSCYCPKNDCWESVNLRDYHIWNGWFNSAKGYTLCSICNNTEDHQHVCHSGNKWVHLELCSEESCDGSKDRTQKDTHNQCKDHSHYDRQSCKVKDMSEDTSSIDTLMHDNGGRDRKSVV